MENGKSFSDNLTSGIRNAVNDAPLLMRRSMCICLMKSILEIYEEVEDESRKAAETALANFIDVLQDIKKRHHFD